MGLISGILWLVELVFKIITYPIRVVLDFVTDIVKTVIAIMLVILLIVGAIVYLAMSYGFI